MASRRSRNRRDKRQPIPGFDDPQPRHCGLIFEGGRMTTPQTDRELLEM